MWTTICLQTRCSKGYSEFTHSRTRKRPSLRRINKDSIGPDICNCKVLYCTYSGSTVESSAFPIICGNLRRIHTFSFGNNTVISKRWSLFWPTSRFETSDTLPKVQGGAKRRDGSRRTLYGASSRKKYFRALITSQSGLKERTRSEREVGKHYTVHSG